MKVLLFFYGVLVLHCIIDVIKDQKLRTGVTLICCLAFIMLPVVGVACYFAAKYLEARPAGGGANGESLENLMSRWDKESEERDNNRQV